MLNSTLLNKKEAAAFLGVSVRTIDSLRKTGLPCVQIGGQIRFIQTSLIEWAAAQEQRITK